MCIWRSTLELILIRHAEALDKAIARAKKIPDSERPLTKKGEKVFCKFIKSNKTLFKGSPLILCSPFKRTLRTLELFKKILKLDSEIAVSDLILPSASAITFKKYLTGFKTHSKIVVISHEPFLSNVIFAFTKIKPEAIKIKKSGVVKIESEDGINVLTQLINPK